MIQRGKLMFLITVLSLLFTTACRRHDIALEKVNHTSEYLYCDKVFSEKRKHIVELNEILVQTGTIDTLEDTLAQAAVIHVKGKELMLNLVKARHKGYDFEEHYASSGYQLDLKYQRKEEYNSINYYGECTVREGGKKTEFAIEGVNNTL